MVSLNSPPPRRMNHGFVETSVRIDYEFYPPATVSDTFDVSMEGFEYSVHHIGNIGQFWNKWSRILRNL
jgi:hypothetical protein